ncbi:ABC transporter permease [Nonomuraea sp. NPDC050383]|uniref:ABC transporter permease n=1 Tax=Nonomuraea sp. NPDC050383 TaxID=3364362 RepID=UPI00379F3547
MTRRRLIFVVRRLAGMAGLLAVVSFVVFALLHLAPGNPIDALLGPRPRSPETVQALTREFHLDRPFLEQYWIWLSDAVRLDFGTSIQTTLPVSEEIASRLPTSLLLGLYAFVITMISGVGLGVLAAVKRGGPVDRAVVGGVVVGMSTPAFVAAVVLLYAFAIQIPWFPVFGQGAGGLDTLWHLTLPAIALAMATCALVVKHTRSSIAGVLDQDYIVFARARGLSVPRILFRYSLRNALIPVITVSGLVLTSLIIGAVLVEVTFSVEGIGQLLVKSAVAKDIPMIQGVTLLTAALVMGANLLADIIYMVVDPRIRMGT